MRITSGTRETAQQSLTVLWSQVAVVEIDDDVMQRAGALAVGADVFATADGALCAAAAAEGLHFANPSDAEAMPSESDGPAARASD